MAIDCIREKEGEKKRATNKQDNKQVDWLCIATWFNFRLIYTHTVLVLLLLFCTWKEKQLEIYKFTCVTFKAKGTQITLVHIKINAKLYHAPQILSLYWNVIS